MKRNESGFTLIELVVVIVILGILAATALPKFVDMSSNADLAAGKGYAAALNSACAINFAKSKIGSASAYTAAASAVADVNVTGTITNKTAVESTWVVGDTNSPCKFPYPS